MSPSHIRRRGRIYRYYVSCEAIEDCYESWLVTSVPATAVEGAGPWRSDQLDPAARTLRKGEVEVELWHASP